MNIFGKTLLEMRLREIGNRLYILGWEILRFNMADNELPNFARNNPEAYNHLVKLVEEEFELSVEEANLFLQLENYEGYEQIVRYQLPVIENSMWTIKQAAA